MSMIFQACTRLSLAAENRKKLEKQACMHEKFRLRVDEFSFAFCILSILLRFVKSPFLMNSIPPTSIRFHFLFLLVLGWAFQAFASADPKPFLHPLFTNHMVIQRDRPVPVWGWTQPGNEVKVTLANKTATAIADEKGKWEVRFDAMPAGGPHALMAIGTETVQILDILVGDVWLCSGQSNIAMRVKDALNAKEEIAAASHPQIRFFDLPWCGINPGQPRLMHTIPQDTISAKWEVCSPETAGRISAVGYYFARDLQKEVNVPIGLICSAVGGSSITSWCAIPLLQGNPKLEEEVENFKKLRSLVEENKIGADYFKKVIAQWWMDNDPGTQQEWFKPETDTSTWQKLTKDADGLPFDGVTWCRIEIDIPAEWAGKKVKIQLNGLWEADTTWFNGNLLGGFDQGWGTRAWEIPGSEVKPGRNVLVTRVRTKKDRPFRGPSPTSRMELAESQEFLLIDADRQLAESIANSKLPPFPQRLDDNYNVASVLFNGMINPLLPYPLKGVLWYQGETPCPGGHAVHESLLTSMIADWRKRFDSPEAWFLIVQLPVLGGQPTTNPAGTGAAAIREVQWKVGNSVQNAATIVTTDLGDPKDIHPKNKQDVGKRLALMAQAKVYGRQVEYSGPIFKSATLEGNSVRVKYDHLGGGLVLKGDKLEGFALAGADKRWVWAEARIDNDEVVVSAPEVPNPRFVHYDYVDVPRYRLWNQAGLPAAPFNEAINQ